MQTILNKIPSPTWRWLRMNETAVELPETAAPAVAGSDVPAGVLVETEQYGARQMPATGIGPQFAAWLGAVDAPCTVYTIEDETAPGAPLRLRYTPAETAAAACEIHVGSGSHVVAVQWIDASSLASDAVFALQTGYSVEEGGSLTLIQVQQGAGTGTVLNDLGGSCADRASFALHQIILGAGRSYYGNTTALSGKRSAMTADIGYYLQGDELLDMNYLADHTGKKTTCDMYAAGVLCDRGSKLFRGTIDFKRGAKDAVGTEMEEVLLMDDTTVCRTIPVILCAEEDVEGNHGASIGRLDESLMFYLESRGMDPQTIYEMMSRARIEAVINRIPEEETRAALLELLEKGLRR